MAHELIEKITEFENLSSKAIQNSSTLADLQDLRVKFLGKKGELTQILKTLGKLSPDERKEIGAFANQTKDKLSGIFDSQEIELKKAEVNRLIASQKQDVTLNAYPYAQGSKHPLIQVYDLSVKIFRELGFDIAEGPEIETDYYNFEALNIPANHPARDMQDTFYTAEGGVLRTHTSPVQIHVMEEQKPPIAMVAPGVVYRCDSDQTHTPMFHQIEALLVDKGIHFGHLKAVVQEFLRLVFERDLQTRFRPSFFPFTEPSAEVDMTCVFCNGDGCRVCKKTGWLEIMGCGMVDPAVFKHVNIDSEVYSGFAFGAGLERITMLKYGINDLRLFFENDVRFLNQF
ncbi:MAG: phenylalanine--tRNA ligase subunit alpha [Deltaproteobacteria bacterium]|nr:phenylalanine--tRNA ligase subunit alpha [Deltaproteobacteria bacterium]